MRKDVVLGSGDRRPGWEQTRLRPVLKLGISRWPQLTNEVHTVKIWTVMATSQTVENGNGAHGKRHTCPVLQHEPGRHQLTHTEDMLSSMWVTSSFNFPVVSLRRIFERNLRKPIWFSFAVAWSTVARELTNPSLARRNHFAPFFSQFSGYLISIQSISPKVCRSINIWRLIEPRRHWITITMRLQRDEWNLIVDSERFHRVDGHHSGENVENLVSEPLIKVKRVSLNWS